MSTPLVQIQPPRPRLPEWARRPSTHFESLNKLKSGLRALNLHTVCESARCPNIHECFHRGAATFMILGNMCTRGCGFCSVPKGNPRIHDMALDPAEPANVARMAAEMKLKYVVITSVNRDDLEDGGSVHFAETVREVRAALPEARVEVLTPDFDGHMEAVARVLDAEPHVFNHNMETVARLYRRVRPQADYRQSLEVLRFARGHRPEVMTKSGFMAGLGETADEVAQLLRDLRDRPMPSHGVQLALQVGHERGNVGELAALAQRRDNAQDRLPRQRRSGKAERLAPADKARIGVDAHEQCLHMRPWPERPHRLRSAVLVGHGDDRARRG